MGKEIDYELYYEEHTSGKKTAKARRVVEVYDWSKIPRRLKEIQQALIRFLEKHSQ